MVNKNEKAVYESMIKVPKADIEHANRRIKEILDKKKKFPRIAPYLNLEEVIEHINITMLYTSLNDISLEIQKIKNNSFLESARKEFSKILLILEGLVGKDIDRPLVENKEILKQIEKVSIRQILQLSQKILFVYDTLLDRLGENNKFKWQFVEFQVRIATIIKNLVNFSELEKYRDPRNPFYRDRNDLVKLCKVTLEEAAKGSRQKFLMSGQLPLDMKSAIELISALRSINVLLGETGEAEKNKTLIEAFRKALEDEEKKKDKAQKLVQQSK